MPQDKLPSLAQHEPFHVPEAPDTDFPETWQGGHAMIIEYGDCEFYASCQCGAPLGMATPDRFTAMLPRFADAWENHSVSLLR